MKIYFSLSAITTNCISWKNYNFDWIWWKTATFNVSLKKQTLFQNENDTSINKIYLMFTVVIEFEYSFRLITFVVFFFSSYRWVNIELHSFLLNWHVCPLIIGTVSISKLCNHLYSGIERRRVKEGNFETKIFVRQWKSSIVENGPNNVARKLHLHHVQKKLWNCKHGSRSAKKVLIVSNIQFSNLRGNHSNQIQIHFIQLNNFIVTDFRFRNS